MQSFLLLIVRVAPALGFHSKLWRNPHNTIINISLLEDKDKYVIFKSII